MGGGQTTSPFFSEERHEKIAKLHEYIGELHDNGLTP